jgi:hypothetical protein
VEKEKEQEEAVGWRSRKGWRREEEKYRKEKEGRNNLSPCDICFSEWLISFWIASVV